MWQDKNEAARIPKEEMADFLGSQASLELVFFNACATRGHVAPLLAAGVPRVIATDMRVKDEVACEVAIAIYTQMVSGMALQEALKKAEWSYKLEGKTYRDLVNLPGSGSADDGYPWRLHVAEKEALPDWSLLQTIKDPLFGLPALPMQQLPSLPYKGLGWYQEADARIFFGREREIRKLYDLLLSPQAIPTILLYGKSGVGKSSFLHAGIIPRFRSLGNVFYLRLTGSEPPEGRIHTIKEDLERPGTTLMVIDQLEEVLLQPDSYPPGFLRQLAQLSRAIGLASHTRMVLSFRKEYVAEIKAIWDQENAPFETYFLGPLDELGMRSAIAGINRDRSLYQRYKVILEAKLDDEIIQDLNRDEESHKAPALQIVLTQMWEHTQPNAQEEKTFSLKAYRDLRARGVLLEEYLLNQIASMATKPTLSESFSSGLAWDFLYFFTTDVGSARSRAGEEISRAYGHIPHLPTLIKYLQDSYLLTEGKTPQSKRLAHDALAPLVIKQFRNSDLAGQRARRLFESRIKETEEPALPEGELAKRLLSGWELSIVKQGLAGMRDLLPLEKALLKISRSLDDAQRKRAQRRRLREQIGLGLIILIGIMAAIFGVQNRQRARQASKALVTVAHNRLSEYQYTSAASSLAELWTLGFDQDTTASMLARTVSSFIFFAPHDTIVPFLPLIDQLPEGTQKRLLQAELAFILSFSHRGEEETAWLQKLWPRFPHVHPRQSPKAWKEQFIARFGPDYWADIAPKYLPALVPIQGDTVQPIFVDCEALEATSFRINMLLGQTEVTAQQFAFFLNCSPPSTWKLEGLQLRVGKNLQFIHTTDGAFRLNSEPTSYLPVAVSYQGAQAYADWLGLRLPTVWEAGYLMASEGEVPSEFIDEYGWTADQFDMNTFSTPQPVRTKAPDKWGLYDLWGNMGEWLDDQGALSANGQEYYMLPLSFQNLWDPTLQCPSLRRSGMGRPEEGFGFRVAGNAAIHPLLIPNLRSPNAFQ